MLTAYIHQAMRHAHYELMENGRFFASIAPCPGLWAEEATLEACRDELQSTLEDWIVIKLRHGNRFEAIDGVDLNPRAEYAEAHQTA
jgi:predicted RNase H-like HicB family nuclease